MSNRSDAARSALLSPDVLAGLVVAVALTVLGTLDAAGDPEGDRLWGVLAMGSAAVATAVAVLGATFSRNGGPMAALLRTLLVPLVAGPLCAVAATVTVFLPPVRAQVEAAWATRSGSHFWFPSDTPLLGQSLGLVLVAGIAMGMLAGLALVVVVSLPWLALRRPQVVVEDNMMDTSPEAAATGTAAARALALLVFLTFAIPTCIVVGSEQASADSLGTAFTHLDDFPAEPGRYWGDLLWVVGVLLLPVGLLALVLAARWQRPDRARRAAAGVPAGLDLGRGPDPATGPERDEPGVPGAGTDEPGTQDRGGTR